MMKKREITKQLTWRDTPSLDKYFREIGKIKLLKVQEEVELVQRIKQGDESALEQLVKANLRFVVSVAKQYQGQGLSLPDLINEGNLGLIEAAGRFDETHGFRFISYAVWWIRQQILEGLAGQARVVRIPMYRALSVGKIKKASALLEQKYERQPTAEEIAQVLDITLKDVKMGTINSRRHVSIDVPLHEDGDLTMADLLVEGGLEYCPVNKITVDNLKYEIESSLKMLSSRDADIINLYFGRNGNSTHTLEEIGDKLDLTKERVRQIKEKALKKIRESSRSRPLRAYLN